jgi:hypothetical protein
MVIQIRRLVPAFLAALAIVLASGAQLALADSIRTCGQLEALSKPNQPSPGGGLVEGGGSATIGGTVYRLSSALPNVSGTNVIGDNVAIGKRVCLSGDPVGGTTDLLNNYRLFASDVDVCGSLSSYQPATATTNNVLSLAFGGALHDYQLVGAGSTPADLGGRSTGLNPEIVRLVGRTVQGIKTVTDYEVSRVPSCGGLPNTSTSHPSDRSSAGSVAVSGALVLVLASVWLRQFRRVRLITLDRIRSIMRA